MISCSRGLFSGVVLMAIACGPNAGGLGSADAGQPGSDSGSSGTEGGTAPTPTLTATTDAEGSGSTGVADSGSGGTTTAPGTTSMSESSSGEPPTSESSSGEPIEPNYPACAEVEPACPEEYFCLDFYHLCTFDCDPEPCPVPTSGDATAICVDPPMNDSFCVLDCSGGATCPDGMNCMGTMFGDRCSWP